ncbi:hypothetical protein DIPPA_00548 [Diplonema papillatum]|nr:hypothetical protein DIPPA_00548 [Diplonema papillatum]
MPVHSTKAATVSADDVDMLTVAQQFSSVPEVMEFESWWFEGGQKRYMLILYHSASEVFEIMVDDSTVPMKVAMYNRKNEPLKAWDLHVGAVVDILGKATTLMKARQSTMGWLDSEARRLHGKQLKLVSILKKFTTLPDLTPLCGVTVRKLDANSKSATLGGTVSLAKLARTVAYLENEVRVYRDI